MRRLVVLIAVAIVTSLALAVTLARAAAPLHERLSVDDTFTVNDCGFAVEEHDVGTLQFTTWFDESGNRTRAIVTAPGLKITWTNAATGASVTTANPFVVHRHFNPDGSVTIAFTGLVFALNGGGKVYVNSGREVIVFSNGEIEPVSAVGPHSDLCEALAATIG